MTITANAYTEPEADGIPPRVRLEVTATAPTPAGAPVSLMRMHPDGKTYRVLLETDARLSSGSWTGWDYLPRFNEPMTYAVTCGSDTANVGSVTWEAAAGNLFPWDVLTGGPARMIGWAGGTTPSEGTLSLGAGQTASASGLPVEAGTTYTLGLSVSDDATVTLQFQDHLTGPVGDSEEQVIAGLDRSVISGEAPDGAVSATVTVTAGGSTIAVIDPVWLEGTDYPVAAPPTSSATGDRRVLVTSVDHWLHHPTNPLLSVKVSAIQAIGDVAQDTTSQVFWPVGADLPSAVGEGSRRAGAGQLSVVAFSEAELAAVRALLADGGPIMTNIVGDGWRDLRWAWIQPLQSVASNPFQRKFTDRMIVSFPYQEIGVPAGYTAPVWTVQDVADTYATVLDVVAAYATVADLAIDSRVA